MGTVIGAHLRRFVANDTERQIVRTNGKKMWTEWEQEN